MNGFRRHLLNHACYAADDGTGSVAADAPSAVIDTPAPELAAPAPATPEPDPAKANEPDSSKEAEPKPWVQSRIAEITRQRHEAERRAELAERKAAELDAKLRAVDPNTPPDPNTERLYTEADLERRAAGMAMEKTQADALQRITTAGSETYTPAAFNAACNNLDDIGAGKNANFMSLVAGLPNAHAVLHSLGTGSEAEAARILTLPLPQMALALARMDARVAAPAAAPAPPAPKPVSRAPAPIEPVTTRGSPTAETDPEKMSPEQYASWRDKQRADRRGK